LEVSKCERPSLTHDASCPRHGGQDEKKLELTSSPPWGEEGAWVQTGNMVYRINRVHGLHCIGKEEIADAVEGNQCHGPKNSIDC